MKDVHTGWSSNGAGENIRTSGVLKDVDARWSDKYNAVYTRSSDVYSKVEPFRQRLVH